MPRKKRSKKNQKGEFNWKRRVLVTGGASFIGSHLVDRLVELGAKVRVVDDFSSGRKENIEGYLKKGRIELLRGDLKNKNLAKRAVKGMEMVFHLACDHGGRGYVDLHQAACSTNLILDGTVFLACKNEGVGKIVYASSGCVYPNYLQKDPSKILYLTEDQVGPPYEADNLYGWSKLMGEKTLKAYYDEWGMKTVSCRFFTVYGERAKEDHAIMAMIARAFLKQDPFEVWGDGRQIRNWTYVGDTVAGAILAAEKINDGSAVNLGTMERIRVIDAVREILRYTRHKAKIKFEPEMPTGPYNRVADTRRAWRVLGWRPEVKFKEGLKKTIDWYFATKNRREVKKALKEKLTER